MNCNSLKFVKFSQASRTNELKFMDKIFSGCTSLESLDLSFFDTSNVINMESSFYECSSLTSLEISNFKTTKDSNLKYMFYSCSSLTSLNLPNFDTTGINDENLSSMFEKCSKLNLYINTEKCSNLISLIPSYVKVHNITINNYYLRKE